MYKKSSSILTIAFRSFTGFFENFSVFFKYILPPVLLQILASVILGIGIFIIGMQAVSGGIGAGTVFGGLFAVVGTVLLCKAIWSLLIRMGGLVLISKQIVENEPLRELKYYTETFKNRRGYVMYLLITGFLIPLIPFVFTFPKIMNIITAISSGAGYGTQLLYDIGFVSLILTGFFAILGPFLIVTLQSFVLNPKLTPWESIVKGMRLSGSKYLQSWGLMLIYGVIMLVISLLLGIFAKIISIGTGISYDTVKIAAQLISQFLQGYTILCFTWWYLRLEKEDNRRI